ncbi:MAG: hypothetical protein IJB96_08310 [Lachnospira sp.]|nr:hypothetical protein [Lachnospira sp.]
MSELLRELLKIFTDSTGISQDVQAYANVGGAVLIGLGIVLCVFGFRSYRALFSGLCVVTIAYIYCTWLASMMSWREAVTAIAVMGTVVAFFAYRWYRVGGLGVCFALGACLGWLICPSIVVAIICGVIAAVGQWLFPVIVIILTTSAVGGCLLVDTLKLDGFMYLVAVVGVMAVAVVIQLIINRNQKLFTRTCPEVFNALLEKKRNR